MIKGEKLSASERKRRLLTFNMNKILLVSQLISTLCLTGVIWLIQVVQYPLFAEVGAESFQRYHGSHAFWITPVVAPMMIIELGTSVLLLFYPIENIDVRLIWVGLVLSAIVWLSTFFLQVPMHEKLASGFDLDAHSFLVKTNWIRTVAWSLRSILVTFFVWKNLA